MTAEDLDQMIVGTGALARLLALTSQRVNQLAAAGVLRKTGRGQYLLGPAVRAYVAFRSTEPSGAGAVNDYRTERTRLVRFQADLAQLEIQKERGELVPVADIVDGVGAAFTAARTRWLAVPTKYAARVTPDDPARAFKVLTAAVREVLAEISEDAVGELAKLEVAR